MPKILPTLAVHFPHVCLNAKFFRETPSFVEQYKINLFEGMKDFIFHIRPILIFCEDMKLFFGPYKYLSINILCISNPCIFKGDIYLAQKLKLDCIMNLQAFMHGT